MSRQGPREVHRARLVLAAALAWLAAAPAPAAEAGTSATRVAAPQGRGQTPAPEYDLAIVKIDPAFRWQGGLEELARFDVYLANRGQRAIEREQVECLLAGRTFRGLEAGRLLRPGEVYQFTVQVKGREVATLAPGRHAVVCTAVIVQPPDAHDGVPENDRATGFVEVPVAPPPELAPQALALRDCETLGPAVAGRPVCLEVTFVNLGGGLVTPWQVACELDNARASVPGPVPLDKGAIAAAVIRFEGQRSGEHAVLCRLDADQQVSERDEANNEMRGTLVVAADTGALRYDLAVTGLDAAFAEVRDRESNQPAVVLGVRVKNLGTSPVAAVDLRCEVAGTDLVLTASSTGTLGPGDERTITAQAWGRRLASLAAGRHDTTCVAGIVEPAGVVEIDVANNAFTAAVAVKR
jgi:hypothetical protein